MKLLRLTTENDTAYFEAVFNSDLVIKPYSKIALSSFTTQLNNLSITIDNQNNELSYTVDGDDNIKTIILPNGTYTSATIDNFWIQTTKLFNSSMENTRNQINRQWFCGVLGGRAVFKTLTGNVINIKSPETTNIKGSKNVVANGTVGLRRDPLAAPGDDSFIYIKSPVNKGCGVFRCKINVEDDPTGLTSGFIIGYQLESANSTTDFIDPAAFVFGIRYVDLTQPYKYIVNGVETPFVATPAFLPLVQDTLAIESYEGLIRLNVYRNTNTQPITLFSAPYNHQTDFFPIISLENVSTTINNIQFTTDPYYDITSIVNDDEPILHANNNIVIIPTKNNPTNCFILFNIDLASILGYKKARYPDFGFDYISEPIFLAEKAFELRDYSESYIIELLNIKLESMCSLSGGQRNFLYVIPQLSAIKEHVVFQVPQLIFLNMNNSTEINLREVSARVLKDTLSSIKCYGLSELVIIIKDKDEI